MNPEIERLLARLDALFPGFRASWHSDDNLFLRDDDDPVPMNGHTVWCHASMWLREHPQLLTPDRSPPFAEFLNTESHDADVERANAVMTCFLENHAGDEPFQSLLKPHLRGEALKYWEEWGG